MAHRVDHDRSTYTVNAYFLNLRLFSTSCVLSCTSYDICRLKSIIIDYWVQTHHKSFKRYYISTVNFINWTRRVNTDKNIRQSKISLQTLLEWKNWRTSTDGCGKKIFVLPKRHPMTFVMNEPTLLEGRGGTSSNVAWTAFHAHTNKNMIPRCIHVYSIFFVGISTTPASATLQPPVQSPGRLRSCNPLSILYHLENTSNKRIFIYETYWFSYDHPFKPIMTNIRHDMSSVISQRGFDC